MRLMRRTRAWAILADRTAFIGVGWFDRHLERPGLSIVTFRTRREARAALADGRVRAAFPRARVVPVTITVEEA